jgi:L-threonylcarbamoyladenylate synthase
MSEIFDATGDDREVAIQRAAEALQRGELAVVPTDTLYGVAADAFSTAGTRRVFQAKHRSRRFPLPVLVRSPKQLNGLVTTVPAAAQQLMAAYWPGALTMVVAADPNLMWDLGDGEGTVSVRMPLDELTLEIVRAVGPLAVTSANRSGQTPAGDIATAQMQLGEAISVYVDGGPRRGVPPSTIVDLTRDEPHILREGALPGEQVLAVARGELDPFDVDASAPASAPDPDDLDRADDA